MSDESTPPSARERLARKRAAKAPLPARKLWAFRIIAAVVLPLLFLAVLEGGLRLVGAGWPTSFLVLDADGKYLRNNPKFSWLYFAREIARQPQEIRIDAVKQPGAIRVFVLGESAAMGDPNPTFGICRMIEAMLEHDYPGQRFEVVNTGVTAINSHVVRTIAAECAKHEPDLYVAYIGNNEVLGPFGPGAVLTPAMESLAAIRLQTALKRTKLGQVIGEIARRAASGEKKVWLGLELFAKNQLSARDPGVERVRRQFRANMESIASIAKGAGAPIIFCTVAVNLENCAPFASLHEGKVDIAAFDQAMAAGADVAGRDWAKAEVAFRRAVELSPNHAAALYWLGRATMALGKVDEGAELLAMARDEDALRFRTERPLNAITREVAKAAGAPLVDLEAICAAASNGAPGFDLFYEHVHMNFRGNFVMAEAAMPAIRAELAKIRSDLPAPVSPGMTEEDMRRRIAFTPMAESGTVQEGAGPHRAPALHLTERPRRSGVAAARAGARPADARRRRAGTHPCRRRVVRGKGALGLAAAHLAERAPLPPRTIRRRRGAAREADRRNAAVCPRSLQLRRAAQRPRP
jgi:hypothetical protein